MQRFLCPSGLPVLIYIFLTVPLCGVGFSISLTESLYIPNFIMEVVKANPLYALLYSAVIIMLFIMGFRYIFSIHAILLDNQTPLEALKTSKNIIRNNLLFFLFVIKNYKVVIYVIFYEMFMC